jgi:DNA polymerase-3 subunit delta
VASPFGKILLITGNSEFEAERTRRRAVAAVVAEQPDCQLTESGASGLQTGEFAGLTSASLFSDATAVVLTDLQDLPETAQTELLDYAVATSPDVAVVLVHAGGNKARGLLDKLRKIPAVTEVKVEQPKYERDYASWVQREVRDLGRRIEAEAAGALVESIGQDLRALSGAVGQLIASHEDEQHPIDLELVRQYFGGRADVRGYEIADAAISGQLHTAMEAARWAGAARVAPLVITAAFASGLRSLAKLQAAPSGLRDNELAGVVGAPPFKLRILRQQLSGWDAAGLAGAIRAVADADLAVKGGGADPGYAIERLVLEVANRRVR